MKQCPACEPGTSAWCRNALSLSHCVSTTLASIAPALNFFFGFAVIVAGAGLAAAMTILTARIGVLILCGFYGVAIMQRSPGLEQRIGSYAADQ